MGLIYEFLARCIDRFNLPVDRRGAVISQEGLCHGHSLLWVRPGERRFVYRSR